MRPEFRRLFGALILALLLTQCAGQADTIIIEDAPRSAATAEPGDSTRTPAESTAEFRQLNIGEIHPISTLDPLFADNNAMKRTVQLIFEGLVKYNSAREIVPAAARTWSANADSTRYQFTLRDDLFYHDSEIFPNGLGRKVVASDVRYLFERMAQNNVPGDAARLFMNISGFEPYFNEQRYLFNPSYRELEQISGIGIPNDSTVTFSLEAPDGRFLEKLASPYAVIYPREAVRSDPRQFAAVGSGPFELAQRQGDSLYTLSRYDNFHGTPPRINRVDVRVNSNESRLIRMLATRDIHLLPELGPQSITGMISKDSVALIPGYRDNYRLLVPGGITTHSIQYYPPSMVSEEAVSSLFATLEVERLTGDVTNGLIAITLSPEQAGSANTGITDLPDRLLSSYSDDPFQQWMMHRISTVLGDRANLKFLKIRTPSNRAALYTSSSVPLYKGDHVIHSDKLLTYTIRQTGLAIPELRSVSFNRFPWWIDLTRADLPPLDQL